MGIFNRNNPSTNQPNEPGKPTRNRTEHPERHENRGVRTCPKCKGSGNLETEIAAVDDNGETYTEYVQSKCGRCKGEGVI